MQFVVCLRKLKQGLCINLEGWDGEGDGRKVQKGGGYTLEKAMAPHSSTLAWKIPWMEEPGRLLSMACLTLCDPRDGSPPGSPIPGIL